MSSHPLLLERAALKLATAAESVNEHIMDSGLAYRRDTLRDAILEVRALVDDLQEDRRKRLDKEPEEYRHAF